VSAINVFIIGQVAKIKAIISNSSTFLDVNDIELQIKIGKNDIQIYTESSEPAIIRTSLGHYEIILPLVETGTYKIRWQGTGQAQGAGEGVFLVKESSLI